MFAKQVLANNNYRMPRHRCLSMTGLIFKNMKQYKHIFFDLDKTLWDFDRNSFETFKDIFNKLELKEKGIPSLNDFIRVYTEHNLRLWDLYRKGEIEKEVLRYKRFDLTLKDFGINDFELANAIGSDYIYLSPLKTNLFPESRETLEYLKAKYTLHIITNGFEEVQHRKIKASDLNKYFENVITSEESGCKKPDPMIFKFALNTAHAKASESLMIGDDIEVDIIGARNSGIDQVYFNYHKTQHNEVVSYEITELKSLRKIL